MNNHHILEAWAGDDPCGLPAAVDCEAVRFCSPRDTPLRIRACGLQRLASRILERGSAPTAPRIHHRWVARRGSNSQNEFESFADEFTLIPTNTGRDKRVACASLEEPIGVWFNLSDLSFSHGVGGYFDIPGYDYTRIAARQDVTGCEGRCRVVEDPALATLLVSAQRPSPSEPGQFTVSMSLEGLRTKSEGFDLTMDPSPEANVPLVMMPSRFWQRVSAIALPTTRELRGRRLAIWVGSNCCRTTWDRQGYMVEVAKHLGEDIDFGGLCQVGSQTKRPAVPQSWDGGAAMMGDNNSTQLELYSRYWFVFSLVNTLSNDNVDEKFFEPFLANSVPVVISSSTAGAMAPGGPGSFIDATQFESPASLARYLQWLRGNPSEYLKFFDYRQRKQPPAQLAQFEQTSAFDTEGSLCRLCSCLCDDKCMTKRSVSSCGYLEREIKDSACHSRCGNPDFDQEEDV